MALPGQSQPNVAASPDGARLFYSGAALLLLALTFLGFDSFYLHGKAYLGRELHPAIRPLLIVHGIGMSLWMLLFVVQTMLIATRNRRVHMMLGQIGAVLSACMVILGLRVAVAAAQISPPQVIISGLSPRPFMIVPITIILAFALFVTVGLWNRRRPEIHRPMMLLAALAAMPAPLTRIYFLEMFIDGTRWERRFGESFGALVLGAFLLAMKWLLTRSFDRWFAAGYAALVVASVLMMRLATTREWDHIATFLVR